MAVSWNQRSATDAWSVPGAAAGTDFSATVSATAPVNGLASDVFASNAGVVADVQAWVNSPGTNFGWMLLSQAEQTGKTARHFGAREALDSSVPVLNIAFDPPATPPTLTVLLLNNAQLRFSFSAEANRPYVVESRAVFGSGAWGVTQSLAAPPSAVVLTVTNPSAGAAKFFRVRTP